VLLEGQLDEEAVSVELELLVVSSSSSDIISSKDSPLAPPPPPPPLQEIARILKQNTIRKKRSFFIYFP